MRKLILTLALFGLAGMANAYNIKHSYSNKQNNSVEFNGECKNGKMLKVIKDANNKFSYEGPKGDVIVVRGGLDKAAAAACGE